jgi:uncharacterized protein YacL
VITTETRTRPDDPAHSRGGALKLLRATFLILLVVFTSLLIVTDSTLGGGGFQLERWWYLAVLGVLVFFAGVIALDVLTPKRKLSTISAIFVGLIAGVIVSAILSTVIDLFANIYEFESLRLLEPFKILMGLGVCYLTISTVLQTQDDFRLVIPYVEFAKKIRGARPMVLDTSALVDGRVLGLAETGIFQSPLCVPRFVVEELQRLSDSADRMKRARGRRGLETVSRLQKCPLVDVSIEETIPPGEGVDQLLVELARALPGSLVTTDTGLRQVAAIQGVPVINLHELAGALKQSVIPGEPLTLAILRRGEQPGQGVGYLEDGTMVVVEDGEGAVGNEATITVTSSMQTSAGRLIFGRIGGGRSADAEAEESPTKPRASEERVPALTPSETSEAPAGRVVRPPMTAPPTRGDGAARGMRNPRRG